MTPAPKIEDRWVCIAGAEQAKLAAQLSSYFNDAGTYFAVFEFPKTDRPYSDIPHDDRLALHLGRIVAFVGDADERVAETEGTSHLGGGRKKGNDALHEWASLA